MPQELDEKKNVIVPILDNLRLFNPSIGSYDKSMLTEDFDYSVKLSNGRMRLPEELITDFERNPSSIGDDRYKAAAAKFVPNETPRVAVPQTPKPAVAVQPTPQPVKKKSYTTTIVVIILVFLAIIGLITISNNPNSIPGVKVEINTPKPIVLSRRADNRKSDIKMRTTVYADIQNQGGNGNVMVVFHLTQGGNKYDRTQTITLNSGETRAVEATFDEVTRLGGDMTYNVEASAQ
jgi:hypothetical protein